MARVKGGNVAKNRRRKVLKQAKGYFGSKHRLFKTAQEQTFHSGAYAFRDRKQNKRNFRKLWITRVNAACRENEISYSQFINGLNKAGIEFVQSYCDNRTDFFKRIAKRGNNHKFLEGWLNRVNDFYVLPKEETTTNS